MKSHWPVLHVVLTATLLAMSCPAALAQEGLDGIQDSAERIQKLSERLLDEAERQHVVNNRMGGVIKGFLAIIQDLEDNDLFARGKGPELKDAVATLDTLSKRHVPNAARYIEDARRELAMLGPNLDAASGEITVIINRLNELMKKAGAAGAAEDMLSRLRLIIRNQDKLLQRTMQWGRMRIINPARAGSGREPIRDDQHQIAQTVRMFQEELAKAFQDEIDIDLRKSFGLGLAAMEKKKIDEILDTAARLVGANKEHSAVRKQIEGLDALRELELLLDPDKLAKLLEELDALRKELLELLKREQKLTAGTKRVLAEEFPAKKDPLILTQRNIRKDTGVAAAKKDFLLGPLGSAQKNMSAAEQAMQSNQQTAAVKREKLAENDIKKALEELEAQYNKALDLQALQMLMSETMSQLEEYLQQIEALIERQKQLIRATDGAPDIRPLKAPQDNLGAEAVELAGTIAMAARHLQAAGREMHSAAAAMPRRDKPTARKHQDAALRALQRALSAVRAAMSMFEGGGDPGEMGEGENGEGEAGEEGNGQGNIPGRSRDNNVTEKGEKIARNKAHWDALQPGEQKALKQNFARELPLEYRDLLGDYYEALSR